MKPTIQFHHADAVQWANDYKGELFHAALMDAPYEMNFMGKGWDNSGVAFDPETWKAFAKVLHPGAFLFVFAGTINDDLISVAMREAGLRKFHKMAGWVNGAGFPKASRLNHGHPLTEVFKGHRYGLQALKPAIEMVLIFQKPYAGRPIDCITATGAGCLNVDGGRIGTDEVKENESEFNAGYWQPDGGHGKRWNGNGTSHPQGRWPANFYIGDPEAARRLDAQSGESKSNARNGGSGGSGLYKGKFGDGAVGGFTDSGGASRFFLNVREQIDEADPVRYVAKASRRERDAGLDGMPLREASKMSGGEETRPDRLEKGMTNHPLMRNVHPTVKPLALTRYLATLLLPPAEYAPRRIFIPFSGVGSEAIGAMQAGWEFVQGVEITEEYLPIAQARADYWTEKQRQEQMVMPL